MIMRFLAHFLIITCCFSSAAWAQGKVEVRDLNLLERQHNARQIQLIDDIGREKLGQPIRHNKDDLELLQRIIHLGLVDQNDTNAQQAMGVVLGDVLVRELGLEWKSYTDHLGESRATCAPNTQECLFPVTMLSRRMAVGLLPNVSKLFEDTSAMIAPYLPQNPYAQPIAPRSRLH
jgi:hypothetical protein